MFLADYIKSKIKCKKIEKYVENENYIFFKCWDDLDDVFFRIYEKNSIKSFDKKIEYYLMFCSVNKEKNFIISSDKRVMCYNKTIYDFKNERYYNSELETSLLCTYTKNYNKIINDLKNNIIYDNVSNFFEYNSYCIFDQIINDIETDKQTKHIFYIYYKSKKKINDKIEFDGNHLCFNGTKKINFKFDFNNKFIRDLKVINNEEIFFKVNNREKGEEELWHYDISTEKIKKLSTSRYGFDLIINDNYDNIETITVRRCRMYYDGKKFIKNDFYIELYKLLPTSKIEMTSYFNNKEIKRYEVMLLVGKNKIFLDKYNKWFETITNNGVLECNYLINKEELIVVYDNVYTVSNEQAIIYGSLEKFNYKVYNKNYYKYEIKNNFGFNFEEFRLKQYKLELKLTQKGVRF